MHFNAKRQRSGILNKRYSFILGYVITYVLCVATIPATAVTLSEIPLEVSYTAAPPVVMFLFDDSTSMDWELMTQETDGVIIPGSEPRHYLFNDTKEINAWLFDTSYLHGSDKDIWKIQWSGYNAIYYSPFITYDPWPNTSGVGKLENASMTDPYTDPISTNNRITIDLSDTFCTADGVLIRNSHYYLAHESINAAGNTVYTDVYLVNLVDSTTRDFYRVDDKDKDGYVDLDELVKVDTLPESYDLTLTPKDDLQNFANWFTYYRKRILSAKASVAKTIVNLENIYVGFYSINGKLKIDASSVKIPNVTDQTETLLTALYGLVIPEGNATPLRNGLATVGEYFRGNKPDGLGESPYATAANGGECQRVYALVITDGYWNQKYSGVYKGDIDGDGYSDTLADVALAYFEIDLRTDLNDQVLPTDCDELLEPDTDRFQQRMVTFTVSFGVSGSLNPGPEAYNTCTLEDENDKTPPWPNPLCDTDNDGDLDDNCLNKIDDLWHAAANTTGEFFNASDIEELTTSLINIFRSIDSREVTGASVAVNAKKFRQGTTLFQCFYNATTWYGDVRAYEISYSQNNLQVDLSEKWSSSAWLDSKADRYKDRIIVTYNDDTNAGIPFKWKTDVLTADQVTQIVDEDTLNFVRGKNDIDGFRSRTSILGDIVHSSPLVVGKTVYVGANDGMLHAFNKADGVERFAYVPNLVFPKLKDLKKSPYNHRYYVDQTPVCSDIVSHIEGNDPTIKNYLVGGLNAGGRGYYCLDITDIDTISLNESIMAQYVKWEFTDPELGYSFSTPVIIRTYSETYPYVVVFGNGYNSDSGYAQLFVVDVEKGTLLARINTEKGDDNGMSSPIATDVNNDLIADFVYAGDLKGNLWKFDFRKFDEFSIDAGENTWEPSPYKDASGKILPLFTTAENQPITSRPDVMRHCSMDGYIVCFGTGRYLNTGDLSLGIVDEGGVIIEPPPVQAIYGIWDYGDGPEDYLGAFDPETNSVSHLDPGKYKLLQQSFVTCGADAHALDPTAEAICSTSYSPNWHNPSDEAAVPNGEHHVGWYLNLSDAERIDQDVSISCGMLNALSKIPPQNACSNGGSSTFYFLDPCTGGMNMAALEYDKRVLNPPQNVNPGDETWLIFEKDKVVQALNSKINLGKYMWKDLQNLQ